MLNIFIVNVTILIVRLNHFPQDATKKNSTQCLALFLVLAIREYTVFY